VHSLLKVPPRQWERESLEETADTSRRPGGREYVPPQEPLELKRYLDRFVIGNERAKRVLAIEAYHHQLRSKHVPSVPMVSRILDKHFDSGPAYQENQFHQLALALTGVLRANPISNRRDSRARRDVCDLLRTHLDQHILAFKKSPSPPRKKPTTKKEASRKAKGAGRTTNPSGEFAGIVADFIGEAKKAQERLGVSRQGPRMGRMAPLLIGESGSGKSMLVKLLADRLRIPFAHVDGSQITEAGWSGADATSIPGMLLRSADTIAPRATKKERLLLASQGLVFIDEIDKKAWVGGAGHEHARAGAQANFLMALDGYVDAETGVDLSSCLFVLAGSFTGATIGIPGALSGDRIPYIAQIIQRRLGFQPFGFSRGVPPSVPELLAQLTPSDLIDFGIIPELAGRVAPVAMDVMTEDVLFRILDDSRSSPIRLHAQRMEHDGIELRVSEEAKRIIASAVLPLRLGARPLAYYVGKLLEDIEFEAPNLDSSKEPVIRIEADDVRASLRRLGLTCPPLSP
jgi:ATP-dependent Clp protease ATP-binding subunit ClpX